MACLELGWGHDRLVSDYHPAPVRGILNAKCSRDKEHKSIPLSDFPLGTKEMQRLSVLITEHLRDDVMLRNR
jgi:hypothetical protein